MPYSQAFIDRHRDINVDYHWWDQVYDDFKEICDMLGLQLQNHEPQFSGFCSQGDGASFAGIYRGVTYATNEIKKRYETAPDDIRRHAPEDTQLHAIADDLCTLNRVYTPMFVSISRPYASGSHVYAETMHAEVDHFWGDEGWQDNYDSDKDTQRWADDVVRQINDQLTDIFRRLAGWLYNTLEEEYMYLTSDEAIVDALEANDIVEEQDDEDEEPAVMQTA
jgi:hypothetical protein